MKHLHSAKRLACLAIAAVLIIAGSSWQQVLGLSKDEKNSLNNNGPMYLPETTCAIGVGLNGGGGGGNNQELDGYKLPAAKGYTGLEEDINTEGRIPSGGRVTFAQHASKGQEYRDYYITMRWTYAEWFWNGTANIVDQAQMNWMGEKPRLVLVTNPRTNKSIIAAILESGPAPWTGIDTVVNNNAKQGWKQPQIGTSKDYKGRVSGFPPKAMNALEATMGQRSGDVGDELLYAWAPDQNATPGPTSLRVSGVASSDSSACPGSTGVVNAEGYAFPLGGIRKQDISSGYSWPCPSICHHDNSPAFDLAHVRTAKQQQGETGNDHFSIGLPVRAIHDGTIQMLDDDYENRPGCYAFQLVGDDGWQYWYGHLAKPKAGLQNGSVVKAGEKIAEIGPRQCTGNNSYPHLHIDRGFPKGHHGGGHAEGDKHRDPGFVDLMNTLYQELDSGGISI